MNKDVAIITNQFNLLKLKLVLFVKSNEKVSNVFLFKIYNIVGANRSTNVLLRRL